MCRVVDDEIDAAEPRRWSHTTTVRPRRRAEISREIGMAGRAGQDCSVAVGGGAVELKCTATRHPRAASCARFARPMPREAPVTRRWGLAIAQDRLRDQGKRRDRTRMPSALHAVRITGRDSR